MTERYRTRRCRASGEQVVRLTFRRSLRRLQPAELSDRKGPFMGEESPSPRRYSVVIVEDHDVVALGLRALLDDAGDIDVVAIAGTVEGAVAEASARQPDVVLMDYRLPDGNGVDATRRIRAVESPPNVVMISSSSDRRVLGLALEAGCCGFISKNADRTDLVQAIRRASLFGGGSRGFRRRCGGRARKLRVR